MELSVFLAVLLAALLHASWNTLVKRSADKHFSMTAIVMGHAPLALLLMPFVPLPAPESWPYLAGGIGLHVGYQLSLLMSYRIGDLTQVYPIARGVAPLIVAAISVTVLGVELSGPELIAVATIALGIMSLVFVRAGDGLRNAKAAAMAVATGCFIAGYSLVDGLGARESGTAVGFYAWLTVINAIVFPTVMAAISPGTVRRVATSGWKLALTGGTASFVAYAVVIWAFTQAPIALVTALRETSIIFALPLGVIFLNERVNLVKLLSTATTMCGMVLLRLAR